MFESLTMAELRTQLERHFVMIEEVLGGMDTFVQDLNTRVSRMETSLGINPEGTTTRGALADISRIQQELWGLREFFRRNAVGRQ
mgnify:CR=1 FL=1